MKILYVGIFLFTQHFESKGIDRMKKIVLIGPVYPYKGGISHYTGLMYKALKEKYDVMMVSYKMQYPKILFKKEQRDYSNDAFKINETNYWINTANPFNIIQTAKKINKWKPDMVIIQWWHPYFAPCYCILSSFLKNTKILYVCHNVFPHERFPMDKFLTKTTLKHGNCYIVQSRQYKGLKHLINAMPIIQDKLKSVRLMVVGDFGDDKQSYLDLIRENHCEKAIDICDGYIPDQEVEKYFAACDLVVCPYESATQSGIIQIAYGFDKPVVATNVGGLPDVVKDKKTGYLVEAKSPDEIAKAIIDFYENKREQEFEEHIKESAYEFSWERMVEIISVIMMQ